jgi:hypothetical protein
LLTGQLLGMAMIAAGFAQRKVTESKASEVTGLGAFSPTHLTEAPVACAGRH